MSSLRNTVQRRNHRERAQPTERSKWGILEKPKDYKLRAADHKVKKRKLKALQQRAADRNEDEFYFGMLNSQSQGGRKVAKRGEANAGGGGKVLSAEAVKLMKTQDVGYLRTVLQQTRRERERVGREVVSGDVGVNVEGPQTGRRRVVFEEDAEGVPPLPEMETEDLSTDDEKVEETEEGRRKGHALDVKRRKLQTLEDRERDLSDALEEVEVQRARMNGSIGGVNKKGVKFKVRQRSR